MSVEGADTKAASEGLAPAGAGLSDRLTRVRRHLHSADGGSVVFNPSRRQLAADGRTSADRLARRAARLQREELIAAGELGLFVTGLVGCALYFVGVL